MIIFNMSSDISNEFDSFEEDRTIYRSNSKHEHEFIDFLSGCDGINVYPSFNEIENDLIIKKSYKFGLDSSSLNMQEENSQNKFSNSKLLNSNEIKDRSCGVYSKIFTIQRDVNNRYLDNINMQSINLNKNSESCNWKRHIKEDGNSFEEYDSNKTKKERFGRKQDKVLFNEIKDICSQINCDIKKLPENFKDLNPDLMHLLYNYCSNTQWKGTSKELHSRIIKLLNLPFSIRENKTLIRMLKYQIKSNSIDLDYISYHLPGKSVEAIINQSKKLKQIKRLHLKKLNIPNNPFA